MCHKQVALLHYIVGKVDTDQLQAAENQRLKDDMCESKDTQTDVVDESQNIRKQETPEVCFQKYKKYDFIYYSCTGIPTKHESSS